MNYQNWRIGGSGGQRVGGFTLSLPSAQRIQTVTELIGDSWQRENGCLSEMTQSVALSLALSFRSEACANQGVDEPIRETGKGAIESVTHVGLSQDTAQDSIAISKIARKETLKEITTCLLLCISAQCTV